MDKRTRPTFAAWIRTCPNIPPPDVVDKITALLPPDLPETKLAYMFSHLTMHCYRFAGEYSDEELYKAHSKNDRKSGLLDKRGSDRGDILAVAGKLCELRDHLAGHRLSGHAKRQIEHALRITIPSDAGPRIRTLREFREMIDLWADALTEKMQRGNATVLGSREFVEGVADLLREAMGYKLPSAKTIGQVCELLVGVTFQGAANTWHRNEDIRLQALQRDYEKTGDMQDMEPYWWRQ